VNHERCVCHWANCGKTLTLCRKLSTRNAHRFGSSMERGCLWNGPAFQVQVVEQARIVHRFRSPCDGALLLQDPIPDGVTIFYRYQSCPVYLYSRFQLCTHQRIQLPTSLYTQSPASHSPRM
jgi:hypothetical protein